MKLTPIQDIDGLAAQFLCHRYCTPDTGRVDYSSY